MHHYRDIDHPIVVLHFADHLPLFLNTLNSENMSWHHTRQCIESVARRQFFFFAHEQDHVQNDQLDSSHNGALLFLCSSINPTLHHLFSTHSSSSFSESISIPKRCKGASTWCQWQILPFSIVGLVLRPGHVQNKFEPCMVVAHVLFVDDESRGASIFQFACFSLPSR